MGIWKSHADIVVLKQLLGVVKGWFLGYPRLFIMIKLQSEPVKGMLKGLRGYVYFLINVREDMFIVSLQVFMLLY